MRRRSLLEALPVRPLASSAPPSRRPAGRIRPPRRHDRFASSTMGRPTGRAWRRPRPRRLRRCASL